MKLKNYVIGIDGGGTKTITALADLKGKILKTVKTGPSSPRNVGPKIAAENLAKGIKQVLGKGKISSTFIGLAAIEEEAKKQEIKKELLKQKGISQIFKEKFQIGSDQIAAFYSGTDKKDGIVLIAGTGCVAHGWRKQKEAKVSGWGIMADEGSAFWVGQKAFQAALKDLDKRGQKTLITNLMLKELKIKSTQELLKKVYSENLINIIPYFSILCDEASIKGDKIAKQIMKDAAKELILSAKTVISGLGFKKEEFPLVLVGGMFKSKIILDTVMQEIKKIAPKAEIIRPKIEPVMGAIKLALGLIK